VRVRLSHLPLSFPPSLRKSGAVSGCVPSARLSEPPIAVSRTTRLQTTRIIQSLPPRPIGWREGRGEGQLPANNQGVPVCPSANGIGRWDRHLACPVLPRFRRCFSEPFNPWVPGGRPASQYRGQCQDAPDAKGRILTLPVPRSKTHRIMHHPLDIPPSGYISSQRVECCIQDNGWTPPAVGQAYCLSSSPSSPKMLFRQALRAVQPMSTLRVPVERWHPALLPRQPATSSQSCSSGLFHLLPPSSTSTA